MGKEKTEVRILSGGIDFKKKSRGGGVLEHTESVPAILWGHGGPRALLSLFVSSDYGRGAQTLKFEKRPLAERMKTVSEMLSEAADDYPLTYKVTIGDYMNLDNVLAKSIVEDGGIVTADIDGDGTEELIIPRTHGEIDVYDTKKRLFRSQALKSVTPKYQKVLKHIAPFGGRDVVYYAYDRGPAAILQIDGKGIRQIVPRADWKLKQVHAVGAINYPGSQSVDEIVLLHSLEEGTSRDIYPEGEDPDGSRRVYLSRLKPDGTLIGKTRELYADFSDYGNTQFIFVPQSRQTVMSGASGIYLVTPEKPVNWVKLLKPNFDFFGVVRGSEGLLVLLRDGLNIYAVDEESRFYTRGADGRPERSAEMRPWHTITLESPRHRLLEVITDRHVDRHDFLVVQEREPQVGVALPWQDYLAVAEKYMKDDVREERLRNLKERSEWYFDIPDAETAERKYKEKYGKSIPLPTREDVRKHFPEHYRKLEAESEKRFQNLIVTKLLDVVHSDNAEYYKDYKGYCRWVESETLSDDSEMVFTLTSGFREARRIGVPGYYRRYFRLDDPCWRMPLTGFRRAGDLLTVITVGQQKEGGENEKVSPPRWLLIRSEGGKR